MQVLLLSSAALLFAVGGFFMKQSQGVTRLWPSVAFLCLFSGGALCQALAMRRSEMGPVYILVLGLEAIAAFALSVFVLGERANAGRLGAIALILVGIVWLQRA